MLRHWRCKYLLRSGTRQNQLPQGIDLSNQQQGSKQETKRNLRQNWENILYGRANTSHCYLQSALYFSAILSSVTLSHERHLYLKHRYQRFNSVVISKQVRFKYISQILLIIATKQAFYESYHLNAIRRLEG